MTRGQVNASESRNFPEDRQAIGRHRPESHPCFNDLSLREARSHSQSLTHDFAQAARCQSGIETSAGLPGCPDDHASIWPGEHIVIAHAHHDRPA